MRVDVIEERIQAKRDVSEKTAILQRLARIEGQVRGLRQMAEGDRGTVEQIQQVNAVIAALREVALLSISQEVKGQVAGMAGVPADNADLQRLVDLLRSTFRIV
ncbi:metal-sensitive transcriptional regulator [Lichenihabitans sp. Uapishka_5]|uniref:metal-sensitive transcriptional regulator n=1 Tax=Lichenihabitans sp. Uapishka_5 TaxID=3037302 RepID=UPI0029E81EB2|nr:metal-sensitive transcriptional regulator [Lichenihabitans sp. Uapishka_5]MDX7953006.1 metal-sensitive transcriptional regulator [Lichenihabitans sp. Uapishka_5]